MRIDVLISELSGLTRSQVHKLIENGHLTVNGGPTKPNYKARNGDAISISVPEEGQELIAEDLPIQVLYQDDYLIVVNKPPGMVVYPAAGHSRGTLMNAVAFHAGKLASIGGPLRPGVVHRLDKDTSGIMVIALDDRAYYDLVEQFRHRTMDRRYGLWCLEIPEKTAGPYLSGSEDLSLTERRCPHDPEGARMR